MNYISTAPFNTVFFTYSTSMNGSFQTIGALTAVTGATAGNCPAGRILRANNKKLYPDAAGLDATTYPDRTPLVGVFDYHSGLSGFIDPNNSVFALYNGDKPVDTIDGTASSGANNHKGMSVYTGGNVTASGSVTAGNGLVLSAGAFNEYRPLIAAPATAITLTSTDPTVVATYMVGAIITQTNAGAIALTLPSTADLITALGSTVGATFRFTYLNLGSATTTLTPTAGTTIVGSGSPVANTILTLVTANFVVRLASATTVVVYRV